MQIDTAFIRSKLSRRIVTLFVLCALIPITLLAAISLWDVNNQIREQNRRELRYSTHEQGMIVYERLTFIDTDLRLAAANQDLAAGRSIPSRELPSGLERRVKGLELVPETGEPRPIFGQVDAEFTLAAGEWSHLQLGKTVVATRTCGDAELCVFMFRQLEWKPAQRAFLVAEVSIPYLLEADNIPQDESMCILDEQGRQISCSSRIASSFSAGTFRAVSGEFESKWNGREYESHYWQLFLKPNYYTDHWTIIASEARDDIYAPLATFKRIFLSVALLALWVVALLSLIQIRRNLVPLAELQKGTQHIANGDFQNRVVVKSGDEFEDLAKSFNAMAARIEKQVNTLKGKNAIDRAILSSWDIEKIIDSLFAHLHPVLPYKQACVSLVDSKAAGHILSYLNVAGSAKVRRAGASVVPEREFSQLAMRTDAYIVAPNDDCPKFLSPLASQGMRFFLVAPVAVRGELAGIVSLGHDGRAIWSDEDILQARQVADQAGVALSNARLVGDLRDLNLGILTALARAIDAKSHWTAGHSERVTEMALKIAREMQMSPKDLEILRRGGLLHDIGKIGIPGDLLDSTRKLTDEELAKVREHVEIGRRILEPIQGFAECMPVITQHHEWVDGSGYPHGLIGAEISIHARIFAVADCYDAMISERPYRPGMPLDKVIQILRNGTGTQFDATVMSAFLRVIAKESDAAQDKSVSREALLSAKS